MKTAHRCQPRPRMRLYRRCLVEHLKRLTPEAYNLFCEEWEEHKKTDLQDLIEKSATISEAPKKKKRMPKRLEWAILTLMLVRCLECLNLDYIDNEWHWMMLREDCGHYVGEQVRQ